MCDIECEDFPPDTTQGTAWQKARYSSELIGSFPYKNVGAKCEQAKDCPTLITRYFR